MPGDTELARALGELQGQVAALQTEWIAHRAESRVNTDRLHQRISDGNDKLSSMFDANATAIRAIQAARVGDAAVSKFKRTVGLVLIAVSGGSIAEAIRAALHWSSKAGTGG